LIYKKISKVHNNQFKINYKQSTSLFAMEVHVKLYVFEPPHGIWGLKVASVSKPNPKARSQLLRYVKMPSWLEQIRTISQDFWKTVTCLCGRQATHPAALIWADTSTSTTQSGVPKVIPTQTCLLTKVRFLRACWLGGLLTSI